MIGALGAYIKRRIEAERRARSRRKKFKLWLKQHLGSTYAHFCADSTHRRLQAGGPHPTLGVKNVDEATVTRRAQRILEEFKRAGCRPHHVVVDYGCGSLWIGEAFMNYLEPGNYIGLDVVDFFYKDALARLSAEFVASRRPTLRVIDEASLAEVRERRPDFIFSFAVMQHVPPGDLSGYFSRIVSLAGPHTRIEIDNRVVFCTWGRWPSFHWHTPSSVRRALAPLGYVADYRAARRIVPAIPGISLVRR
jgi:hypothetical protein